MDESATFTAFPLSAIDYLCFLGFFAILSLIGYWAGRRERASSDDYFLAGRSLPWYVVGGSFIASNISSEHFIGMIGAAFVFGICVAVSEWANVFTFSLIIWFFIPFLMASRVFTMPEFLERRFNPTLRQFFAFITVVSNVAAFLAPVLYGGGIALQSLFGWPLWFAIPVLGLVAGFWAIYGGLSSVAWTDLFTVIVMLIGGVLVTVLGLKALAGDSGSLLDGFSTMIEANRATSGTWREVVELHAQDMAKTATYDRLSVIQPVAHVTTPWVSLFFMTFTVSIWYNVLNQFMIQRVLGARNAYHARMGMVMAGFLKLIMPVIVVIPGLILFALHPEVLKVNWADAKGEADKGYIHMIQTLLPLGLRGLFLAALFGAIQSTVNSVLNSSATIVTIDFYRRVIRPRATDAHIVRVGVWVSVCLLIIATVTAGFIKELGGSLFVYIQSLYHYFAPPFAAVFLLGILSKRITAAGATGAVFVGLAAGAVLKAYVEWVPGHPAWIEPYGNQAIVSWLLCLAVCVCVSSFTKPPRPEQVTDTVTFNWRRLNILGDLGTRWYTSVVLWWAVFAFLILGMGLVFSGLFFGG